jgi:glycosyltransferase involved in cell wall biosynthesis
VALPRGEEFQEFEVGVAAAFLDHSADFDHVLCLMPNYASGPLRDDAIVVCHGVWWDHDLWGHLQFRTPEWYEHLERVFTRPRRVVSVDTNSIGVVRSLYPDAAARMACIPNAVDIERFVPPGKRPERIPEVVFPRRADIIRGPHLVGPVLDVVPDPCRVRWVGEGDPDLVLDLRAVAARDGRFEVTTASFDDMPEVFADADIVVIPTVASEGQSLACLEAMAAGCAVVVTRVGGLPELVTDGVDGFVCDPTAASIGAALRRLVRDPALRARLGAAARRRAETHSLARWRSQWAQVFAEEGWVDGRTAAASANPYDIVCFGIIDWRYRWQRPQQLMTAWARRGRRVFHIHITDFLPPGGDPMVVEPLADGVWEVRLALPEGYDVYAGDHPEGFVDAGMAGLAALATRFGIERAVSVVELATWEPLATAARDAFGWRVVYDCMDDWSTFPGFADTPAFLRCEEELVARADRVVVSARTIQRRWESWRPDVVLARNAVDVDFYQRDGGDDPLPDVQGRVAGFFGAIVEWFDTELLVEVARARPKVTFVLAGGVQRTDVSELEALPNVRFLGHQPYEALPALLRRFDACLVPFRVSPVTDGMDVVKFYEYVSLGKPVVSTPIAEIVPYADLLYLADGPDAFGEALDVALAEDDAVLRARRVRLARSNTWDERLDRIEEALLVPARPSSDHLTDVLRAETERWRAEAGARGDAVARWRAEAEAARDAELHLRRAVEAYERSRVLRPAHLYWRVRRVLSDRRAARAERSRTSPRPPAW